MDKLFEIEHLRLSYARAATRRHPGFSAPAQASADGTTPPAAAPGPRIVTEIDRLVIPRGVKAFIVGESGIGKSTILETLGMMNDTIVDDPGMVLRFYPSPDQPIDLKPMWEAKNERRLAQLRLRHFNFIFQSTNLMPGFTAYENICFTRMLQGYSRYSCYQRAHKVMEELGLGHVSETRMAVELSGGQQQRLAFARAILPDFTVLFGDEPTGNLDAENAVKAMQLLSDKLDSQPGASAIIVTHDMPLAMRFADVIIKIRKEHRIVALTPGGHGADPGQKPETERITYGRLDDACVFVHDEEMPDCWTNGTDVYPPEVFEDFLRKK